MLLAAVTPAGAPALTRWQLAADLIADIGQLEQRITAVEARIKTAVAESNTSLVELFGVGPVRSARFLGRGRRHRAVYQCLVADQHLAVAAGSSGSAPVGEQPNQGAPPAPSDLLWLRMLTFRQERLTTLRVSRYLDDMDLGERQAATLATASSSPDPEVGLRAVVALRACSRSWKPCRSTTPLANGWSWQQIASRLGVTKQAVHQKHGPRSRPGRGR